MYAYVLNCTICIIYLFQQYFSGNPFTNRTVINSRPDRNAYNRFGTPTRYSYGQEATSAESGDYYKQDDRDGLQTGLSRTPAQTAYDSSFRAPQNNTGGYYGTSNVYPGSPYRSGRPYSSSYDIYDAPNSAYGPKNGSERCIPKCFAEKGNRVRLFLWNF